MVQSSSSSSSSYNDNDLDGDGHECFYDDVVLVKTNILVNHSIDVTMTTTTHTGCLHLFCARPNKLSLLLLRLLGLLLTMYRVGQKK